MITIGLHGMMGSGKSTVARCFAELGACVIDADALAHEVLEDADAKRRIVDRFGTGALAADGHIDRARLAKLVFGPAAAHATALADLEAIVHPLVHRRIEGALVEAAAAECVAGVRHAVVLDVPLLVKSGWDRACDAVLRIECDDRVREERLRRRGVEPSQQAARDTAWRTQRPPGLGPEAPMPRAPQTFSVDTSRDLAYTRSQVDRIWHVLMAS